MKLNNETLSYAADMLRGVSLSRIQDLQQALTELARNLEDLHGPRKDAFDICDGVRQSVLALSDDVGRIALLAAVVSGQENTNP